MPTQRSPVVSLLLSDMDTGCIAVEGLGSARTADGDAPAFVRGFGAGLVGGAWPAASWLEPTEIFDWEPPADVGEVSAGAAVGASAWPVAADLGPAGIQDLVEQRTVEVPISLLRPADSPRLNGADNAHARMLAQTDAELPPILVHRGTMRVIDGTHRLEAAAIRGAETIRIRYFDGRSDEAFVLAVESNVQHGLPLSLADRKAAAARIVRSHPQWSDRAIAAKAGLAHKTVGTIRRLLGAEIAQVTGRVGRDGRIRRAPASAAAQNAVTPPGQATATLGPADAHAVLRRVSSDPSLRYTDAGRIVLRILDAHAFASTRWDQVAEAMPEHLLDLLSEFMRKCVEDCNSFTAQLQRRQRTNP